jgi:protein SCO1/2
VLATYVAAFDADLVGLRGTAAQIAAAARAFAVVYALRTDIDPIDYPVEHGAYSYLMDRDWRLLTAFRPDATAEDVAATLRRFL